MIEKKTRLVKCLRTYNGIECNTPKYTLTVFGHVEGLIKVKYEFSGNKMRNSELVQDKTRVHM